MNKFLLCFLVFLFSLDANAQADSLKWVKEINDQVWKPFVIHFTSGNREGFRSLHSKKVTRVEIDDNIIQDYEKYFPSVNPDSTKIIRNAKRLFELRFDKRISDGMHAWETGFYKGTVLKDGKEPWHYYGRFFVVLEKENGTWKILVDADTGKDANELNFNKASAME